jgi:hypothetical protein
MATTSSVATGHWPTNRLERNPAVHCSGFDFPSPRRGSPTVASGSRCAALPGAIIMSSPQDLGLARSQVANARRRAANDAGLQHGRNRPVRQGDILVAPLPSASDPGLDAKGVIHTSPGPSRNCGSRPGFYGPNNIQGAESAVHPLQPRTDLRLTPNGTFKMRLQNPAVASITRVTLLRHGPFTQVLYGQWAAAACDAPLP